MAKNVLSLQLLRNSAVAASKEAAISAMTASATQDGVIKLARYTDGDTVKTIFGIYNDTSVGTAGYTIYDSYQEVISAMQADIAAISGASVSGITAIEARLGDGVTSGNTATQQLQALSGSDSDTSATTSVAGAKKYTDDKIATLDYTDTAVTGNYVSKVDEVNGVISVTRVALPSVNAISEAGKPITAVSESLGEISATAGTIEAQYVTITDSDSHYTASTVEGALAEVVSSYTAADAAIVGDATTSGNTLGKLEDRIEALDADAKEYTIQQITTGLSTNVKEAWGLFDADNHQSGATINIYKDSAYKEIYLGTSADTINTTTGEITKQSGDKQSLNYAYMKDDGTYDLVKVDVSAFLSESEFQSGVTATNHVVHGVVDSTSEVDSNNSAFLTVGADGFKIQGIKAEIAAASGAVNTKVEELSGKTVTEVASSNSSITATLSAATDGTKHLDVITDASKIQMSGFTSTDVLSGITSSSSITEAFKEVDAVITANEQVVSAALNDLEATKVENIVVNGVTGTFNDKVASVTIDGADIKLDGYQKPAASDAITSADTVNQAIGKLEKGLEAATSGGITGATVNNARLAITDNVLTQTVAGKQTEATTSGNEAIVVETDANGNLTLGLAYLDAGTY